MHKELIEKLLFEIDQINKLIEIHHMLIMLCRQKEPDSTELAAIGTILHSFYNGVEKIFVFIAKEYDFNLPNGQKWHRDVIKIMCTGTAKRNNIISKSVEEIVLDYLGFRHYFRHSYDFSLNWSLIKNKFLDLEDNWTIIKSEICDFIKRID